jgi:hypothetical protein
MRPGGEKQNFGRHETMNAVMAALSRLDAEISREMFQDRIGFASSEKFF